MEIAKRAARLVGELRRRRPLVHSITNYVTVNDCANILLAAGASPLMADDVSEAGEIAAASGALVLNIGTLNERTIESMLRAGRAANERGVPVVFDPVGAGASSLRNFAVQNILDGTELAVLRGNLSEIKFIGGSAKGASGVDASASDTDTVEQRCLLAQSLAAERGCVVAITGERDVVSDGRECCVIENGVRQLSLVTGTGCMCTALIGAYAAASDGDFLAAAVAGIAVMGIAGETAWERTDKLGTGSFRTAIIDAVSRLDENGFKLRARIHG